MLVKLFPHVLHVYGLSPVCILMCFPRLTVLVKLFPHVLHAYGPSPVCILMCFPRLTVFVKLIPHVQHVYGFPPVCIIICTSRWSALLKVLLHVEQVYCVFFLRMLFIFTVLKLSPSSRVHDADCQMLAFSSPLFPPALKVVSQDSVVEERISLT